jgi:hypothetical protein
MSIIPGIMTGQYDDELEGIIGAINHRRKMLREASAAGVFHTLKPGDKVRLVNLRPKYLVGQTATVVRKNQTRVVVTIDNPPIGGRFQGEVTAAAHMLEKIQ